MALYTAKIPGDICPGSDITINTSWSGAGAGPVVSLIDHILQVDSIPDENGILTVTGTVNCNGNNISIGPITLTVTGATPSDPGDPGGDPGGGGGGDPG